MRRLCVFAVVAAVSLTVVGIQFAQLPQRAGIGRYTVVVRLPDGGGLYTSAGVTYRGVTIGTVTALRSIDDGAEATLALDSSTRVPVDLDAAVRGMSAVGEQYVDLVPRGAGGPFLSDGAVIPRERASTSEEVGPILDRIEASLTAVGTDDLRTVIDESATAVAGLAPQLRALVTALGQLADAADEVRDRAATLIDEAGPLLDTQTTTGDSIREWTSSVAALTDRLRAADPHLRGVLAQAAPAAEEVTALFTRLRPTLPLLLSNLVTVEQVAAVYNPALEQILVLYPPLIAASQSAGLPNTDDPGQNTFFANQLSDPPPCIEGFLPPEQRRSPADTDTVETPNDLYCKVSPDDPRSLRGARNLPCLEFPGRRAPTVQLCRNPSGADEPSPPPETPPASTHPAASDPADTHPAAGIATYDTIGGTYVGRDGNRYAVGELAGADATETPTLANLLAPAP
ncbi:MCE family protein [Nocardia callitridis]|uniref:MCE family protein n=1 Tax=Nocardia callitridis TaxID=648753 RepID=UPI0031ECA432